MRAVIIFFVALLTGPLSDAQSTGDFRSVVAFGDWNVNTSWETFNGSWGPASLPPALGDNVITVQSGHTISFVSDEIIDQVVVNGTLKVNSGVAIAFPASSTGDVILINGTLDVSGSVTQTASTVIRVNGTLIARQTSVLSGYTASNMLFQANSMYQHLFSTTSGSIPLATWAATSTCLMKDI